MKEWEDSIINDLKRLITNDCVSNEVQEYCQQLVYFFIFESFMSKRLREEMWDEIKQELAIVKDYNLLSNKSK